MSDANTPKTPVADLDLSVVVPLCDHEAVLTELFDRLYPVLDGLGRSYEVVLVDDASRDRSTTLLRQQHKLKPDCTRVLVLGARIGRAPALRVGLAACAGRRVITLGGDLQDPPEEIPPLLAVLDQGRDLVAAVRRQREDSPWYNPIRRASGWLRGRVTGVGSSDPGASLQGYDRDLVTAVLAVDQAQVSFPALAWRYALNPTEVVIGPGPGPTVAAGVPLHRQVALDFDLMTGLSLAPLRALSLASVGVALVAFIAAAVLLLGWLILGIEVGIGTVLTLLFGAFILFGMGVLAAYLGRLIDQGCAQAPVQVREELTPRAAGRRARH
jgi:undecaprenyl-phosphate 4-deoxy-4-formamido-L-arabinose transferase